ncbi:uncharacterized protein FIBRA_02620 [Fibroporia radiculosa]|uniref:Nephrocystin 3-like N-terminal domain-containing protein n=1 Tax=Fibroporia radiculosa TaxID=599839 RepID=J4H1Y5_9APHY|nr:uncharacterized protein FIBRA_02620 [Fibroporia radiculosa]CCM00584.1 predicted protein [Fibroporia radiculosa]
MVKSIADIYNEMGAYKEVVYNPPVDAKLVTETLVRQLLECADFIPHYAELMVFWARLGKEIGLETYVAVQRFQGVLSSLMQHIQSHSFSDIPSPIHRAALDIDFHGLEYATEAGIHTSQQCLLGSRGEVLSIIQDLTMFTKEDAKKVFWLSRMAGTGKSAIAHTIARWSRQRGSLGSCFCFTLVQKGGHRNKIFSTIAIDLVNRNPLVRRTLARLYEDDRLRYTGDPTQQWKKFIMEPIKEACKATRAPILIIIDAQDESDAGDTRKLILQGLSAAAERPPNIRVLMTSRPLPNIYCALRYQQHVQHVSLDGVPPELTRRDVEQYVAAKLADLRVFQAEDYVALGQMLNGNFEWARLSCEYITDRMSMEPNPRIRFDAVIAATSGTRNLLDDMYKLILTQVMQREGRLDALLVFCAVMGQVLALLEPLSMASLVAMQRHVSPKDSVDVESVICSLGALLTGITDDKTPIRPLHPLFYEFLMDKAVTDLKAHVERAKFEPSLAMDIEYFFANERVLFYLEVLSLTQSLSGTARALASIVPWFRDYGNSTQAWNAITDMEQFAQTFTTTMQRSTPHLYLSALPFASTATQAIQRFTAKFPGAIRTVTKSVDKGLSLQKVLHGHTGWVTSVAISHDERIVSGSYDMTIQVWDADVGQQLGLPLKRNKGWILSIAISQDGQRIVSGASDSIIRIWNAYTGQQLGSPLKGHNSWVRAVVFSHDGGRIISGSADKTIRIWDAYTGQQLGSPLKGHTHWVQCVAISYDGTRIVSGSADTTIRVWDAGRRQQIGPPLTRHTHLRIVSGSADKTIRVWDAKTGQQLGMPLNGHTELVRSVAISYNDRRIVSGSYDKTIRVWDADTRKQLGPPLEGHTAYVTSVAISRDGQRIVSDSDDLTIGVWDTTDSLPAVLGPDPAHRSVTEACSGEHFSVP